MTNPFGTDEMAAGYAAARPPVHPRVLQEYFEARTGSPRVDLAVDLGCGAGLSTHALAPFASRRLGVEPAAGMLRWTSEVAPGAQFAVAAGEALPVATGGVGLVTAAGSLNYVHDLPRCLGEVRRVLDAEGVLLVYDFSAGRRSPDAPALAAWFAAVLDRHPYPASEARPLDPTILAREAGPLVVRRSASFTIPLVLDRAAYLAYVLTETNVAAAVRAGTPLAAIRTWIDETLRPAWATGPRTVLFDGYWVEMGADFGGSVPGAWCLGAGFGAKCAVHGAVPRCVCLAAYRSGLTTEN